MYAGHNSRSSTSRGLYFHHLSGRRSRRMSRAFCSSFEMCNMTLTMAVPDSDVLASKSLICR
jgi:hypothetical protein